MSGREGRLRVYRGSISVWHSPSPLASLSFFSGGQVFLSGKDAMELSLSLV
jgi:hypothetical protein